MFNAYDEVRSCVSRVMSDLEPGRASRRFPAMENFGSIWLLLVAQLANRAPDVRGLLYLSSDGELLVVGSDDDAPESARYVCRLGDGFDPLFVAARLRHAARML
jgi:hypothetical protein